MMGLVVEAQVIRDLIGDGEYLVECIEQRERGKVAVAFVLRARAQPYSIQIETADGKLGGLFRALLDEKPVGGGRPGMVKLGSQQVPVVEVESLPLDAITGRKRRKRGDNHREVSRSEGPNAPVEPTARNRRAGQQLALVPQEPANVPAAPPAARGQRTRARRVIETSQGHTP
jgi:hypothetical protein